MNYLKNWNYSTLTTLKKSFSYIVATALTVFGLLTLFLSSSFIFDLFGVREKQGNYVLFVVYANFICSIIYLLAAYGFIKNMKWTTILLGISTIVLIVAFIGLSVHINSGEIYETKTIGAMIFRITITLVFTLLAYFTITKNKKY